MPLIPFGEWGPDLPAHLNDGLAFLKNALPGPRGYCSFKGLTTTTDALAARCRGMYSTIDSSRSAFNFAGDETKLYLLASNAWGDVSQVGNYSLGTNELWDFTEYGDLVIACGHGEDPQSYEIGVSALFADLSATAPQGRHCATVRDSVVLGNVFDAGDGAQPNRVAWGPIGNPAGVWTPSLATLAGHQNLEGEGGGEVQAIQGGEFGIVLSEWSIWRMTFVGPPLIFQFDEIETRQGTFAPRSVVKYRDVVYYLGQDGFFRTSGSGASQSIGQNRIDDFVLSDLSPDTKSTVISAVDNFNKRVNWIYPSSGSSNGIPDKLVSYDVVNDRWGNAEIDLEYIGYLRSEGLDMDTDMAALYPNLDLAPHPMDSPLYGSQTIGFAGFDNSHKAGYFTGPGLDAEFITGQHQLVPGKRALLQNMRPILDSTTATTIECNVAGKAATHDATGFQPVDTAVDDEGDCPILEPGRYFRFKQKLTGDWDHAMGIDVDQWSEDGDR